MNIEVEYKDRNENITNQNYYISRLALVKHMAIAGQIFAPHPKKILKTIGMFLQYGYYLQRNEFYNNNRFSVPPSELYDPTEKGQFSNLAGKAIADFLAKKIDNALYTVNYEAAMRMKGMPIIGSRPDLLAFKNNKTFAIESKGYSGGAGNMNNHKAQSRTGGISVNFTVACVSYNLYDNVRCNYHDPYNDNVPYDNELLRLLTKNYYSGLSEFLNEKYFRYNEIEIQGERFFEVELSYRAFEKLFPDKFLFRHFWHSEILGFYRPRLILPLAIKEYAEKGITNEIKPFIFESIKEQNEYLYIDNDRIGLSIRR